MENALGRKQGMFVFFTRIPEIATRLLYMLHAHCNGSHLIGLKESNGGRKRDFFLQYTKEFIPVVSSIRMGELGTKELRSNNSLFFFPNSYNVHPLE